MCGRGKVLGQTRAGGRLKAELQTGAPTDGIRGLGRPPSLAVLSVGAPNTVRAVARPVHGVAWRVRVVARPVQGVAWRVRAVARPVHGVACRVRVVARPVHGVACRVLGVARPVHGVARRVRAVARRVHGMGRPVHDFALFLKESGSRSVSISSLGVHSARRGSLTTKQIHNT